MFGIFGAFLYGLFVTKEWAIDEHHEQERQKQSLEYKYDEYTDKYGIARHASGKKYTPSELTYNYYSRLRHIDRNIYNSLVAKNAIDPDWCSFNDFLFTKYDDDLVTLKELYPWIDCEREHERRTFKRPKR